MPPRNPHKRAWQRDREHREHQPHKNGSSSHAPSVPATAYVQAHEAQLVYGEAETAAELGNRYEASTAGPSSAMSRGRLVRWEGEEGQEVWAESTAVQWLQAYEEYTAEVDIMVKPRNRFQPYDIVHLLSSLPDTARGPPSPASEASSTWDDLPSDEEDRFLLSGSEDEEYAREKKRRWVEALRQERLKGLDAQAVEQKVDQSKPVVPPGYDAEEEPPDAILQLMKHTAQSLAKSPNPRILESRILANHASDERFAFLRGRYAQTWISIKDGFSKGKAKVEAEKGKRAMSGLMGGYASSDEDEDEASPDEESRDPSASPPPPPPPPIDETVTARSPLLNTPGEHLDGQQNDNGREAGEDERKRQIRIRLEEWKKQRAKADKP